ncbi:MAG TPA: hypothetical protein VEA99_15890 [Gemmatimonadaceae bacterium]|nr:hypothetical protein [Gemmatimonadaceae bacterium]
MGRNPTSSLRSRKQLALLATMLDMHERERMRALDGLDGIEETLAIARRQSRAIELLRWAARHHELDRSGAVEADRRTDPSSDVPTLRPYDLAVGLGIATCVGIRRAELAPRLGLSEVDVERSLSRLTEAHLVLRDRRRDEPPGSKSPSEVVLIGRRALADLLIDAVAVLAPASIGPVTVGVRAAHSAVDLVSGCCHSRAEDLYVRPEIPLVWPDEQGPDLGYALTPLYRGATGLPGRWPEVHRLLALVDCIRVGDARERTAAATHLRRALGLPVP